MQNKKKDSPKLGIVPKPTMSFQDSVSDVAVNKLKPMMMGLFDQYKKEQTDNFQGLYERLTALEKLVLEKTNTSDEDYAERVVDVQDNFYSLAKVSDAAVLGDVLRVEVSTKAKDQEEYQGKSRFMIQSLGSGRAIGVQLEEALVGMNIGETKELEFGVDNSMVAKITVNRISRRL